MSSALCTGGGGDGGGNGGGEDGGGGGVDVGWEKDTAREGTWRAQWGFHLPWMPHRPGYVWLFLRHTFHTSFLS